MSNINKIKTFKDFRHKYNTKVMYLRKQSETANRVYVKTGKLVDRLNAVRYQSELSLLEEVIKDLNSLEKI